MKKVRVTYEAIVEDNQIKSKDEILADGYEDVEDAIVGDGLRGVIYGMYEYSVDWEITDVEE